MKFATLCLISVLAFTLPATPVRAEGNQLLSSLGATGAQAIFCNYMAIAELADLFGAKAYDKQKCTQIATGYANLTEKAKDSLTDLLDSGKLGDNDAAFVREMVVVNDLLGKMSNGIVDYIKEPSEENLASYEKNRQKAWKSISKLLGIGE